MPSGGVEPGEDSKEAAVREVVEEVSNRSIFSCYRGQNSEIGQCLHVVCKSVMYSGLCFICFATFPR